MNKVKIDEKENNKNISTKNISRSYNSFLNSHDNIFLSNKNDNKEMINENKFINIDSNANLSKIKKNDLEKINKIIDELKETKHHVYKDGDGNIIKDIVTHILSKFLSKLYPKCEINYGSISLLISKDYYLKNNISNKSELKIEENINYFFKSRYEYKYSKILKFNKEFFQNCGKILINIYSKIKLENISKTGGLKLYRNKINEENLNVLTDYYNYCDENHLDPAEVEKTLAWKNLEKKYNIPPEFIFLFNIFQEINMLDIDLEFASDIETEEDFSLFTISILNIIYIFPKLQHYKLNLINSHLQYYLYENYYPNISKLLKYGEDTIKKNNINNEIWIYGNKWNFDKDFNLENNIKKRNHEKRYRKNGILSYDKYSILYIIEPNINLKGKDNSKLRRYTQKVNNININYLNKFFDDFETIENDEHSFKIDKIKKCKEKFINYQESQVNIIYNAILLIISSLTIPKKFELISNDLYTDELFDYLKENLKISMPLENSKFHIFNLLYRQLENIELFNIEINSLDDIAYKKLLKVIKKNNSLKYFKISFFSSNISYLLLSLIKIYEKIESKKKLEEYAECEGSQNSYDKIENKILDDLSSYFIENLFLLFKIIENKSNLEILGFDFDMPNILINKMNYIIPIYKFILNILFLIDNNERNKKNNIEILTILSINTKFDGRNQSNINNIFENFQIYKQSNKLKELNIQCQFYKINYIKNIISTNLIKLSLGDLDLDTFSNLVNYITLYEFSNKSSLKYLNIKLMNKITDFSKDIKFLFQKLFYIKINNLLELQLFSNVIIKNSFDYLYLIKLLKYNWIPSYIITLNKSLFQNKLEKDSTNIPFLIFPTIEKNSSDAFEVITENIDKKLGINDNELFWILKYIFFCKYSCYKLSFFEVKYIIFNIAQFLYPTSHAKLLHDEKI